MPWANYIFAVEMKHVPPPPLPSLIGLSSVVNDTG